MVEVALTINGKLDILVNNAAIELDEDVVDMDVAVWRRPSRTISPALPDDEAALPHVVAAGGGTIINVTYLAWWRAVPAYPGTAPPRPASST